MGINASYYGNRKPTAGQKPLSSQVLGVDQMKEALPFGKKNPVDAMTGKHLFRLEKPDPARLDNFPVARIYLRSTAEGYPAVGMPYAIGAIEGTDIDSSDLLTKVTHYCPLTTDKKEPVLAPVFSIGTLTDGEPFVIAVANAPVAGCKTPAVAVGMAPALVNISDSSHEFAAIASGVLSSASTGYARIIWKAASSGQQWCLLAIPSYYTVKEENNPVQDDGFCYLCPKRWDSGVPVDGDGGVSDGSTNNQGHPGGVTEGGSHPAAGDITVNDGSVIAEETLHPYTCPPCLFKKTLPP
jgi:hypothetical protein